MVERIQSNPLKILDALDGFLQSPFDLIVYGRSALALGYPSPPADFLVTIDVDAILPSKDLQAIEANNDFWDATGGFFHKQLPVCFGVSPVPRCAGDRRSLCKERCLDPRRIAVPCKSLFGSKLLDVSGGSGRFARIGKTLRVQRRTGLRPASARANSEVKGS